MCKHVKTFDPAFAVIHETLVPGQHSVKLYKHPKKLEWVVAYGADLRPCYDWLEAALEFGCALFHALECAGHERLDSI